MTRFFTMTGTLVGGFVLGAVVMLSVQGTSTEETIPGMPTVPKGPVSTPVPTSAPEVVPPQTSAPPAEVPSTIPQPVPPQSDQVLLVWTPGSLPPGFAAAIEDTDAVQALSLVRSDILDLQESWDPEGLLVHAAPEGFAFPVESMAFDPGSYRDFVPKDAAAMFEGIGPGEALLGTTAARVRNLGVGALLQFRDGTQVRVAGIVDDVLIGGAELAVPGEKAPALAIDRERYLLIRYRGERELLEEQIRDLLPPGIAVRLRAPGETPILRHGDAVLPQVMIKERFGEFAYRVGSGTHFEPDPSWVAENIVTADVPILGRVQCHRALIPALEGAMDELEQRNLAFLVDPAGYRGCWNPRMIESVKGEALPPRGISRHAWGAAVDLNFGSNPTGVASAQDPRLVEVMERWGFTSGHAWLIPDPGHFEYVQPPRP